MTGNADLNIASIEYDSRRVTSDSLFVAISGMKFDGYDFAEQAVANGAVAVLGENKECSLPQAHVLVPNARKAMADVAARFYGYPGTKLNLFGVTGTNGKTTTCFLIRDILESAGSSTGLVTSSVYDTGTEIIQASRTTPESLDLQRLLFQINKNSCDSAVIEVSSHSLIMHRVDNVAFKTVLFTNLTRDHLDFHKSMEEYLKAKAQLLDHLTENDATAVINIDVPEYVSLMNLDDIKFVTYSIDNSEADIYCSSYRIEPSSTKFDLMTPTGMNKVELNIPGRFNLINAVAAAAACHSAGIADEDIVRGLENAVPVPGRLNYIDQGQPFALYVDFAHTPDALERVCEAVKELSAGRLLLLFGCGGDRDKGKRPMMGEVAGRLADFVCVTSDNPRSEDPLAIIEDIKPGLSIAEFVIEPERKKAIISVLNKAQAGDVVLLAGKGAEKYQEIEGEFIPFDEIDIAHQALKDLGYYGTSEVES
ncbi:MAG: UDP-N-acetylmuramoyl-L-alanyl-D-glutamate--2,6-diaminopimelate ligase [candidate division Zixibacteria bacterium]|nr:UDP-N-acetylmuramoyl-L-alanyl-D-glutamate--2,6-diaminopimelate ligase [candidate division Zixibacteria bacterium]